MTAPEGKLKVFISWSMPLSHKVALILREWLPRVIQDVEPWVSSEDIEKGTYWTGELLQSLDVARVGIIVVTPENHERSWLNFEAGALARSIKASGGMVTPLLIDMGTTNIQGPMTTLQITYFTKQEIAKLLQAINTRTRTPLNADVLADQIDLLWSRLETSVGALIAKHGTPQAKVLSERQILEEVLTGIRELRRTNSSRQSESLWPDTRIRMTSPETAAGVAGAIFRKHGIDVVDFRRIVSSRDGIMCMDIVVGPGVDDEALKAARDEVDNVPGHSLWVENIIISTELGQPVTGPEVDGTTPNEEG